jgi:hypothetical protein
MRLEWSWTDVPGGLYRTRSRLQNRGQRENILASVIKGVVDINGRDGTAMTSRMPGDKFCRVKWLGNRVLKIRGWIYAGEYMWVYWVRASWRREIIPASIREHEEEEALTLRWHVESNDLEIEYWKYRGWIYAGEYMRVYCSQGIVKARDNTRVNQTAWGGRDLDVVLTRHQHADNICEHCAYC